MPDTTQPTPSPEPNKPPKPKRKPPQPKSKTGSGESSKAGQPSPDKQKSARDLLTAPRVRKAVVYPKVDLRAYLRELKDPLTAEVAKEILGWEQETENIKYDRKFLLQDLHGNKIRCSNNVSNRPYYPSVAEDWMLEILRDKWRFNGETIIVDRHGLLHDGQHRLIGLILANQEWEIDKKRTEPRWQTYWKAAPVIDALVVLGIVGTDDVVNTIGTGKPRTLVDVLFRCAWFSKLDEKDRLMVAKRTSYAVKMMWSRTAQNLEFRRKTGFKPRRPHSESLEFIANHERLLECVRFMFVEGQGKLNHFYDVGYAAALLYLMGSAASDSDVYDKVNNESALDWKLWDKAQAFWVDICANGEATEGLREELLDIKPELAGPVANDQRTGTIIKAWNLFSDGKPITKEDCHMEIAVDGEGRPSLTTTPLVGGIDVGAVSETNETGDE